MKAPVLNPLFTAAANEVRTMNAADPGTLLEFSRWRLKAVQAPGQRGRWRILPEQIDRAADRETRRQILLSYLALWTLQEEQRGRFPFVRFVDEHHQRLGDDRRPLSPEAWFLKGRSSFTEFVQRQLQPELQPKVNSIARAVARTCMEFVRSGRDQSDELRVPRDGLPPAERGRISLRMSYRQRRLVGASAGAIAPQYELGPEQIVRENELLELGPRMSAASAEWSLTTLVSAVFQGLNDPFPLRGSTLRDLALRAMGCTRPTGRWPRSQT